MYNFGIFLGNVSKWIIICSFVVPVCLLALFLLPIFWPGFIVLWFLSKSELEFQRRLNRLDYDDFLASMNNEDKYEKLSIAFIWVQVLWIFLIMGCVAVLNLLY